MATTENLIRALARDAKPVSQHAVGRRITLGVAGGGVISLLFVAATLGVRPDLAAALRDFSFWVRSTYCFSLGIVAISVTASLARPQVARPRCLWSLGIPILLLLGIGIAELSHAPPGRWWSLWLSHFRLMWLRCPIFVLLTAMPIFGGLLWAFRCFAPARPRPAGAAAGLTAGSWAATLYNFHCPEVSAVFVLTWFTLGIALAALVGAMLGNRLLRW